MPRRNSRPHRKQVKRLKPGQATPRARRPDRARDPLDQLVLPVGRCFFKSRKGKLTFATEADAEKALKQAAAKREHQLNGHVESRFYPCPPDGCGGFHLTSRDEYEERPAS